MMGRVLVFALIAACACVAVFAERSSKGVGLGHPDLRVSLALGSYGSRIRLSVIDGTPIDTYGMFTYNSEFLYKWTNFSLHSVMVPITPGEVQQFQIGQETVEVQVPVVGGDVEGILFGDPCIYLTDFYIPCLDDVGIRLPNLLNALAAGKRTGKSAGIDFWSIIGDMFYDRTGHNAAKFFDDLSPALKAVTLVTVPGNHDFWVLGNPALALEGDQYGVGFMQYYGQDVYSGKYDPVNYLNFSLSNQMPGPEDFFSYNVIGNIGFIKYSSSFTWEQNVAMFQDACTYMGNAKPDWLFLMAHWSSENDGCQPGMDVPHALPKVSALAGCSNIQSGMKGLFGHTHCNNVTVPDQQYLIGASGYNSDCQRAGFVYMRTTASEGRLEMVLFDYTEKSSYETILNCLETNTLAGCVHLGTTWTNITLPATKPSQ